MFPDRKTALQELAKAEELNPGPWGQHSRNVAHAAELIAGRCDKMDSDKAFVCGLLHDIGRRTGVAAVRHIIDGYDYAAARGWDEVARICLTHSFPVKDIEADIGKKDISAAQYAFIRYFLKARWRKCAKLLLKSLKQWMAMVFPVLISSLKKIQTKLYLTKSIHFQALHLSVCSRCSGRIKACLSANRLTA